MAITYPLAIPNLSAIASFTLTRENVVGVSQSPFTFEQQVYQHQGQRWGATLETHPLPRASIEEWRAWLTSLMGAYGTFLMGDPMAQVPRGSAGGTPKVRVGSQSGNELDIYDAETSVNSWLLPGDYIQVGSSSTAALYRVLTQPTTNASGAALLDVWPRLRSIPSSGAVIYVNSCVGRWRLTAGSESETFYSPNNIALAFSAVEAL